MCESSQKGFISHTITAFLLELQRCGSGGGACVCVCVCVCGGGVVVVVKSKPLLCVCVCGGEGMEILLIFFKHDFLIKIMTIDIFINQAIYDTHGCSLQATMIHR